MSEELKSKIIETIRQKINVEVVFQGQKLVLDRNYDLQSGNASFQLKKEESVFLAVMVNNCSCFKQIHMLVSNDPIYDHRFFEVLFALPNQNAKLSIIEYLVSISTPELFQSALDNYSIQISESDEKLIQDVKSNFDQLKSNSLNISSPAEENLFNRVKQTMRSPSNSPNVSAHSTPNRPQLKVNNGAGGNHVNANLFSNSNTNMDEKQKPGGLNALPKEEVAQHNNNDRTPQQSEPFTNKVFLGLGLTGSVVVLSIIIHLIIKPSGVNAVSDQNDDIYYYGVDGELWYNNIY